MSRTLNHTSLPLWLALAVLSVATTRVHAQAVPTATADTHISVFAGLSANYTDLDLSKNGDVMAGFDFEVRPFAGFYPALEGRGLYPIAKGNVDTQENLVGGLRLARHKNNLAGYGDVLFGRGVVKYLNGGQPNPSDTVLYIQNTTNVLSFGGGVDWNWTPHFGLKGDFQLQRYDSPVSTTGELYSKVFTIGLTYRLGSGSVRTRRP